jgi:hypothetical protein
MVAWAQKEEGARLASDDTYLYCSHDDQLFMLSCLGVLQEERRKGRGGHGNTSILRDLFRMGQLDWDDFQKPSPANTRSFRYTAALGQELLTRIEKSEDRVLLFGSGPSSWTNLLGCSATDWRKTLGRLGKLSTPWEDIWRPKDELSKTIPRP